MWKGVETRRYDSNFVPLISRTRRAVERAQDTGGDTLTPLLATTVWRTGLTFPLGRRYFRGSWNKQWFFTKPFFLPLGIWWQASPFSSLLAELSVMFVVSTTFPPRPDLKFPNLSNAEAWSHVWALAGGGKAIWTPTRSRLWPHELAGNTRPFAALVDLSCWRSTTKIVCIQRILTDRPLRPDGTSKISAKERKKTIAVHDVLWTRKAI